MCMRVFLAVSAPFLECEETEKAFERQIEWLNRVHWKDDGDKLWISMRKERNLWQKLPRCERARCKETSISCSSVFLVNIKSHHPTSSPLHRPRLPFKVFSFALLPWNQLPARAHSPCFAAIEDNQQVSTSLKGKPHLHPTEPNPPSWFTRLIIISFHHL